MNAVIHAINAVGRAFVDFATPMLIQSAALILILLLVDLVLRRRVRAVFRYWIWMLVLLKLMLPPSLCSPVSFGTWFGETLEAPMAVFQQAGTLEEPGQPDRLRSPEPAGWTADSATTTNPIVQSFAPKAAPPITLAEPKRVQESTPGPETPPVTAATETDTASAAPPTPALCWQALALLIWAAVALALSLLLLQRAWFVRGLVAQAEEAPARLRTTLDECRAHMGLIRPVAMRLSPNATSPAVCGLLHPVILIPKDLAPKLQGCDLQAVLLHELAHVKRGDLWVNLIQTLLQIAYFYNPLLWLANVAIRRVREQAVDEAVLVAMGETARNYPETLLNVAKLAFRRRPTLSLRLIGVVESKSALSGRIRHILTRPLPQSAKLGLLGLLIVFLLAAVLLPMAKAAESDLSFTSDGGLLDIELVAVRPNAGDEFYDPTGKRLDWDPGFLPSLAFWGPDWRARDFILKIPNTNQPVLFAENSEMHPVDTTRHRKIGGPVPMGRHEGARLFEWSLQIPRECEAGQILGLIPRSKPVHHVDLTLRYFHGPPQDSICTFTGPFNAGQTLTAGGDDSYTVTCRQTAFLSETVATHRFTFSDNVPRDDAKPIIVYTVDGRRHLPDVHRMQQTFFDWHGPLDRITTITFGERPHERVFHNVAVRYPGDSSQTHARYLERMAAVLDQKDLPEDKIAYYNFQTPDEALAVIDMVRSRYLIENAVNVIMATERTEPSRLDEATRRRLRPVAHEWANSLDLNMRIAGVQLGLLADWPEFVERAFPLLRDDYHYLPDTDHLSYNLQQIAFLLWHRHPDRLTPEQSRSLEACARGNYTLPILGSRPPESPPPLTERAGKVMPIAEQEARRLNHEYVGTEHILLALARQEDAVSTQVLANLGINIDTLRAEVNKFIQPGPEPVTQRTLPLTRRAEQVIKYAGEEAEALGHQYIGTEHLLLALMCDKEGVAAQVLANLGLTDTQIRAQVLTFVQSGVQGSEGDREIVLPDVDREAVMLDLASGRLVQIPRDASETNMAEAILALGRGDLVHDGNALILVRNASSEQAEKMTGVPFSTCPIGPHLPQVLQVTTAEGRRYEIRVLAVDEGKNCTLKVSLLSADEDAGTGIGGNLPNGVTVEFLAYSQLTAEGLKWWTPRGAPTTIPDVHEADIEGLGTILAFAIDPPDIDLTVVSYRSGDKRVHPEEWRLGDTNIWFVALEDEGNYANLELCAVRWDFPVSYTVPISADDIGKAVPVNEYGISRISDLRSETLGSYVTALTVHEASGESATPVAVVDANGVRHPLGSKHRPKSLRDAYSYRATLSLDRLRGVVFEVSRANSASVKYANVSLTPQRHTDLRVDVGELKQSWEGAPSDERFSRLAQGLSAYAAEHDGAYPETLEQLAGYLPARGDFDWAIQNVAYLGKGHRSDEPPGQPLAYDKKLLARQGSTYVLYNNGLVLLEGPDGLPQLGLVSDNSGPDMWYDSGITVAPDANDTRVLAPGIRLDGIGSAPDNRAFISTVRDVTETEGRQYRFVLSTKAGETLAPIYYESLTQADGTLWEKYTFDTPYHHRDLESFHLQMRSADGQIAVATTAHDEILAAGANAPDGPPALSAPPGRFALAFDGQNDYLYVPDSESLRRAEQLKVEMWFKPQFPPGPYANGPGWALLAKGAYLGTGRVSLQGLGIVLVKRDDRPSSIGFDSCRTSEKGLGMTGMLQKQPDDWMHFSETFERGSYIPAPGQPLVIGRFVIPSEMPFRGQIAEIRIWDAAQSGYTPQYENGALTGTEPGLLACWTFEEGAGPIARDLSPHANHARLGKSITADEADPKWLDLTQERDPAADESSSALSEPNAQREARFTVQGTVTNTSGQPMEGVWVNVDCGFDQPQRAGRVQTNAQGRYALDFKSPWVVADADPYGVGIQLASVYVQKDGFYDTNRRHAGNLALAGQRPGPAEQRFVAGRAGVVLVNEPYELNFVMAPAARIEGQILDEAGPPVLRPQLWLHCDRPLDSQPRPSMTNGNGWFSLESIPCGSFWFDSVRKHLVRSDAVTLARPGTYRVTLQYIECPSGQPGLRIVRFETPAFDRSDPAFDQPRVVDPNGVPVAGAQVALCTKDNGMTISGGKLVVNRMGGGSSTIVETDDQGRFAFADKPEAFQIVAAHEKGFAWVTNDEFTTLPEVRLQRWGRVDGVLYIGRERGADKRVSLMNYINMNAIDQRIRYDYEADTDSNGRFVFKKVPPGWAEVGYMIQVGGPSFPTYTYTSRTPFQISPGQTIRVQIGGQGRPLVGRFVPPPDYSGPVYFGGGLRALDTARPERPTPDNYDQMTKRQQQQWLNQWLKTEEARAYYDAMWHDPQRRHYSFRIQDDGTFRIEDVIPGKYDVNVWLEERLRGQGRPEEIGGYYGTIEVPAIPEAYSDEPLDLGELVVKMRVPLHVGDTAPLFDAKTLDGNDIRLADYRGRFVLLSFWHPESHPELDRLKELDETCRDSGKLQIIGLGGSDTLDEVRKFVAEQKIEWPQIYFGQQWDQGIAKQYGLSGLPYILLIDPEGRIVATWLRGAKLTDTVREKMAEAGLVVSGQVLDPNGDPVPGAQVALCLDDRRVKMRAGTLLPGGGDGWNAEVVKTDADGRFSFAEEADGFLLVVAHQTGFAQIANEAFVPQPSIRLEPWGRVEGTLRIGPESAADEVVNISAVLSAQTIRRFPYSSDTTSASDGRFVFRKVPPGIFSVSRIERSSRLHPAVISERVVVRPGETVNIQLGGAGRPVVGRLSIPERHTTLDYTRTSWSR